MIDPLIVSWRVNVTDWESDSAGIQRISIKRSILYFIDKDLIHNASFSAMEACLFSNILIPAKTGNKLVTESDQILSADIRVIELTSRAERKPYPSSLSYTHPVSIGITVEPELISLFTCSVVFGLWP